MTLVVALNPAVTANAGAVSRATPAIAPSRRHGADGIARSSDANGATRARSPALAREYAAAGRRMRVMIATAASVAIAVGGASGGPSGRRIRPAATASAIAA